MTGNNEIIEQLQRHIPSELVTDIFNSFMQIKHDTLTETLGRSSPGKFVETTVQILQFLDSGGYAEKPKVDDYLKNLESRQVNLSDDLKITLTRVARANYTLRNKRNIAHKGEVDPNIYDLRFLYYSSQWILSEIIRQILSYDMKTAGKLIEFVQIPINPLIDDFGDKRVVLRVGTAEEELLMLLLHYFPKFVMVSQIHKDMNRRPKSTVSNVISSTYSKRYIEGTKISGYKLTTLGYQNAIKLLK